MANPEILKREIQYLVFDLYGTVVDMQKGLTEAVSPFLKSKGRSLMLLLHLMTG